MSTTRSTCLREPVTNVSPWSGYGLLLIGHGSERLSGPNQQLLEQARMLRERDIFARVEAAVLYGEPALGPALEKVSAYPVVAMPMFMCNGLFTRKIIPERIAEAGGRFGGPGEIVNCVPVGLAPGLAGLIAGWVSAKAAACGQQDREVNVLLVGHGSTVSGASWRATEQQASRLRHTGRYRKILTAYLDQYPVIEDVLKGIEGPVYIAGMFIADGLHAGDDIPGRIPANPDIHYLGAIGNDPGMIDLALGQINSLLAA